MLSGINLSGPNESEAVKADIKSYFENFGKVTSMSISQDASSNSAILTIQFEDVASAIIARGYASGLKFYENIIDLDFVPLK